MRVKHAVVLLMLISPLSWAGTMTFQFRNPNFGGNPNNGAFLLNSAQVRIPLYSITDWHRSPISDSHPFDQPGT